MRLVASLLVGALGVTSLAAAQTALFSDGFESGTVCSWSDGVPFPRVYVSFTDPEATTDVSCGLDPATPCLTITGGLVSAAVNRCCEVDVAAATYSEDVELEAGVRLRGGFDPVTWSRDPSTYLTTIEGTAGSGHRRAVSGRALGNGPVELEGFEIIGATATDPGANSYAVYLDLTGSGGSVTIRDNVIVAGDGGPAGSGAPGVYGADGADGGTRSDDPAAYDAFVAIGSGACNASNDRSYANGGPSSCGGDEVSGGAGGGNQCTPVWGEKYSGLDGADGEPGGGGAARGAGGAAGYDMKLDNEPLCFVTVLPDGTVPPIDGADGSPGGAGANGIGGAACSAPAGSVVTSDWVGAAAAPGGDGDDGAGGGGGGGGGGASCSSCSSGEDQLGGHGGGGGGGGCGGSGGAGGGDGGGSFGIFIVGSVPPVVTGNVITLGTGGAGGSGGSGGPGGYGGLGGFGGFGNRVLYCTGAGGNGGDGGDGGNGGGGGGGCGGVSYGIYTAGLGAPSYCQSAAGNAFSGGSGGAAGAGGVSAGNPGSGGQDGSTGDCSFN